MQKWGMINLLRKEQYFRGPSMPLLNRGYWDPSLHPRDIIGEFIYTDGGKHGKFISKSGGSTPKSKGSVPSAIQNALALALNANTDRKNGTATNPYFSHYGGSWDPNQDSGTNKYRRGNHDNTLNPLSLAISSNVAQAAGLKLGGPVYVNGKYMGNYDDTVPEANTIDVYDPSNVAGSATWGGTVSGGARISAAP
jgi:hypothetical protein